MNAQQEGGMCTQVYTRAARAVSAQVVVPSCEVQWDDAGPSRCLPCAAAFAGAVGWQGFMRCLDGQCWTRLFLFNICFLFHGCSLWNCGGGLLRASPIRNIVVACPLLFVVSLVPQLYVGTAWQRPLDDTARLFTDVAFSTVLVSTLEVIAGGSCGGSREYQAAADWISMFPVGWWWLTVL